MDEIEEFKEKVEDALDEALKRGHGKADKVSFLAFNEGRVASEIKDELDTLEMRTLPRLRGKALNKMKNQGNRELQDFKCDVEDILDRYLGDDVDVKSLIKSLVNLLGKKDEDTSSYMLQMTSSDEAVDTSLGLFEGAAVVLAAPFVGLFQIGSGLFGGWGRQAKEDLHNQLYELRQSVNFAPMQRQLKDLLSEKIETIRTHLIDKFIVPLQKQIEEVRKDKANKAQKLEDARAEIKLQSEKKAVLLEQQRTITELGKSVLTSSASGN